MWKNVKILEISAFQWQKKRYLEPTFESTIYFRKKICVDWFEILQLWNEIFLQI